MPQVCHLLNSPLEPAWLSIMIKSQEVKFLNYLTLPISQYPSTKIQFHLKTRAFLLRTRFIQALPIRKCSPLYQPLALLSRSCFYQQQQPKAYFLFPLYQLIILILTVLFGVILWLLSYLSLQLREWQGSKAVQAFDLASSLVGKMEFAGDYKEVSFCFLLIDELPTIHQQQQFRIKSIDSAMTTGAAITFASAQTNGVLTALNLTKMPIHYEEAHFLMINAIRAREK